MVGIVSLVVDELFCALHGKVYMKRLRITKNFLYNIFGFDKFKY